MMGPNIETTSFFLHYFNEMVGSRMMPRKFLSWDDLLIWIIVGHGPDVLAVCAGLGLYAIFGHLPTYLPTYLSSCLLPLKYGPV